MYVLVLLRLSRPKDIEMLIYHQFKFNTKCWVAKFILISSYVHIAFVRIGETTNLPLPCWITNLWLSPPLLCESLYCVDEDDEWFPSRVDRLVDEDPE